MKKIILLSAFLLITASAQEFNTGKVFLKVTNAGATEFGAPNRQNLQVVRISPLISGAHGEVFDYLNDADSVTAATSDSIALFGQFHARSVIDNRYSFAPPAYQVELNVYGWLNGAYTISHYNVTNIDSFAYNSKFGFEVLPMIDNVYGYEKIEYDSEDSYIRIYKDSLSTFVGLKILSASLNSLHITEWDTAYNRSDSLLYSSLFVDTINDYYEAGELGSVLFPSIASLLTNPGETYDVYIALAVGVSESELDSNMNAAVNRYNSIITSVENDEPLQKQIVLKQNYPNPFNPSTTIEFSIPQNQHVEIYVYNILGQKISTLVDADLETGLHKIKFDANNLASGVYFYSLISNGKIQTRKMMLVR